MARRAGGRQGVGVGRAAEEGTPPWRRPEPGRRGRGTRALAGRARGGAAGGGAAGCGGRRRCRAEGDGGARSQRRERGDFADASVWSRMRWCGG